MKKGSQRLVITFILKYQAEKRQSYVCSRMLKFKMNGIQLGYKQNGEEARYLRFSSKSVIARAVALRSTVR